MGRDERGDDGVLTAYEASALDLWGTRLVVLSACDTGVGQVARGDGVYGLRRALVVAGAETVVTSLWKVDDEATRDLMVAYYGALERGGGRGDALRQAQLAMRADPARRHPYFWATFIAVGDWRTLDGRDVAVTSDGAPASAGAMKVAPVPGCGCRVDGEGSSRARWPTLAIAVVTSCFFVRRRARLGGLRASGRS